MRWTLFLSLLIVLAALIAAAIVGGLDEWMWRTFLQDWWERFKATAEPWVAIGTIGLALGTILLALQTRNETRSTLKGVEVSSRTLRTSVRPLLVDAPLGVYVEDEVSPTVIAETTGEPTRKRDRAKVEVHAGISSTEDGPGGWAFCHVPLQNVGSGLALIEKYELNWTKLAWRARTLQTGVPPSAVTRFDFSCEMDPGDAEEWGYALDQADECFSLDVFYTDIDGDQRTRTHAVVWIRNGEARVTHVALYSGEDPKPFAELSSELATPTKDEEAA